MVAFTKKKGGKNALFLLILFPRTARKMMSRIAWKEFTNLQNYVKQSKNQKSSADHDLGNIQNATPSMYLINTPLLYRKDNSCGLSSSNACTGNRFFHGKVFFLRKELDNKQKTIDNLLNIINSMHRNSDEAGNNFYETENAQSVQINATGVERRFQTENRNNLTVENNAYKDITLSQTQSEGLRNEETQQYRDTENRSIITIENQLIEFRQKQQEKFKQIKKPHISPNSNENLQKWSRKTTLIVGDSMLSGIDERRISKRDRKVKVKTFLELRSVICTIISSYC